MNSLIIKLAPRGFCTVALSAVSSAPKLSTIRGLASASHCDLVAFSVDKETKVGTITLNSPDSFNALTVDMGKVFQDLVVNQLIPGLQSGSVNVNALVLTGSGRSFSAGGDREWLKSLSDNPTHINSDLMLSFYRSYLCIRDVPVPTVAAINGPAVGAGACLATACDLLVASPNSKIGFTFASLGIHAGMGGSHFLPLSIGRSAANEALLTGKMFTGIEGLRIGLVNRLSGSNESEEVKRLAREMAEKISSQHPVAVRSMTRSIRLKEDAGLELALSREAQSQALCYARSDWGEGIDANMERRDSMFEDYFAK